MEINVTLLLQAMLFACSYCFLYRFLFVPACKILDENEELKNELYKKLEQEQQIKDALLQDYHVKNNAFKGMLIQAIPELSTRSTHQKTMFGSTLYCVENVTLSEQDREKTETFLVDHLSQVVKK
jgi:F0F1-type ATP synthase membrane subunit b/b'